MPTKQRPYQDMLHLIVHIQHPNNERLTTRYNTRLLAMTSLHSRAERGPRIDPLARGRGVTETLKAIRAYEITLLV